MHNGEAVIGWITEHGGSLHPDLELCADPVTGLSVFAKTAIAPEERLVSCPFDLAITARVAEEAILAVTGRNADGLFWTPDPERAKEKWNDRMLIGAYIGLHWVHLDQSKHDAPFPTALNHRTYIASLPAPADLSTPLLWTEEELELLAGTNLHGGVIDRKREWQDEYNAVTAIFGDDGFTWERYLTSSTHLSSRAFPSKLLRIPASGSTVTTAIQTTEEEESHPVLLPGVDLFNHARGQPITWLSSNTPSRTGTIETISLVSAQQQETGRQVFNNYGPKPNEELLLGYGFVIEDNPDDVVALKVGSSGISEVVSASLLDKKLDYKQRFLLRRDGKLDPNLLAVLRILISPESSDEDEIDEEDEHALHEQEERTMQLELDVLSTVGQMLDDKLQKMEEGRRDIPGGRDLVKHMCAVYRQGQEDILNKALEVVSDRIDRLESMMDQGMGGCSCCA